MRCILYIDVDVIKREIPYKYVVFSPNRKGANVYEYFHDVSKHSLTNRCLVVPPENCRPKGTFKVTSVSCFKSLYVYNFKYIKLMLTRWVLTYKNYDNDSIVFTLKECLTHCANYEFL